MDGIIVSIVNGVIESETKIFNELIRKVDGEIESRRKEGHISYEFTFSSEEEVIEATCYAYAMDYKPSNRRLEDGVYKLKIIFE